MLEKILRIKNIGKFVNYSCVGDISFRPITLIYSENGLGKTTLSAILRSLYSGEKKYIKERRTLGQYGDSYVALRVNGSNVIFDKDTWNASFPLIEIFDPYFINENIYTGDMIAHQHKRNLHSFAIGKEGVQLSNKIDKLDDKIREINSDIAQKKIEVERQIIGSLDINSFLNIKRIENIDQKINEKNKEAGAIRKANEIKSKSLFLKLRLERFPFENLKILLFKRIEEISVEVEKKVKEHISQCMDDGGELWISQGLEYTKRDLCPFCGQNLKGLKLIEAYRGYFSEKYNSFKIEINNMSLLINTSFSKNHLFTFQEVIQSNRVLYEFWKEYVQIELPDIQFNIMKNLFENTYMYLANLIKQKIATPLEKITIDTECLKAIVAYNLIHLIILKYNQCVDISNQKINQKKRAVEEANLFKVENELEFIKNSKKRFLDNVDSLCKDYKNLEERKSKLEKLKFESKKELNLYTKKILKEYQDRINDYLAKFGADFQIVGAEEEFIGGKPRLNYQFSINNETFDLEEKTPLDYSPCFKNTLSSGDKSSLAYAFFQARLDKDPNLKDKIIIFDDPISSQDYNRKNCTRDQIIKTSTSAKQVIILSHDPYFLRMIWDRIAKSNIKTLYIKRVNQGSEIYEWDIEKETQGEYFNNYFALAEYLESGPVGDIRAVSRCIRPLIEGNLRLKFPSKFSRTEWLGEMISKIRDCSTQDQLNCLKPLLSELDEINEYSKNYHHSQNPSAGQYPINEPELKAFVGRTLKVIHGVLGAGVESS